MSGCILRRLQNCSKYHLNLGIISNITKWNYQQYYFYSQKNSKDDEDKNEKSIVGQTTIFVQQGYDIQELPCILCKIDKDNLKKICTDNTFEEVHENEDYENQSKMNNEGIIVLLDNCKTPKGVLSLISEIPVGCLHPEVAGYALNKLILTESIIGLQNFEHSSLIFERLIKCVLKCKDHKRILDLIRNLKDLQNTVKRLCDELLLRNSKGTLKIVDICECIECFVNCKFETEAEKFWTGIADSEKLINEKNIKYIYKILPKLLISRRFVIGIVEQKIPHVWWSISSNDVVEIFEALLQCSCAPLRTMQAFARWLNTNIHVINENDLETIVRSFTKLDFSNSQIEKALERYIKAKVLKVKMQTLIVTILDYCSKFRIRNHHILNGCSEYFISNFDKISPFYVESFIIPYGYLDFQPLNSIKYWQAVEKYLKQHFTEAKPEDLINIFLHCCYLEMYPLNFVSSIFSPYFLDQVHSSLPEESLLKIRSKLRLLDATLTLECQSYPGPMLPRDHSSKSIWQDGRIKRMTNYIDCHIERISGGLDNFTKNVIIGKLPVSSFYVVDILIHPPGIKNFWSYNVRSDRNIYIAVLILLPENYNSTEEFLIGPQVMRIRHLRQLGLKVVTLDFNKLSKLHIYPKEMYNYIVERMKLALPPTPYKLFNY